MGSFSLLLTTPQFYHLSWTCWDRLKVTAGQPERTLKSLLDHLQVCLAAPPAPGLAQPGPAGI